MGLIGWCRGAAAAVALLFALGCGSASLPVPELPVSPGLVERSERRPLIVVPGVTGGRLRSRETGEEIWGRGAHLLKPRDGGWAIARPLDAGPGVDTGVEAFAVIEEMRLFGGAVRTQVYSTVLRTFEANGYRRGDLANPSREEELFPYAYDWRDDLVASARRLAELLERLRVVRGEERLEVDLVCQSAGGQICRYLAKYGGLSLEEAEAGTLPSAKLRIAKLIMVGTSNGGGIRILRELDRGRSYVPGVGRSMRPEVLFSFASLFQDLPVYLERPFVDGDGGELDVDLMNPGTWETYGFSIFDPENRERVERRGGGPFGSIETWRTALGRFLDRAQRLHAVLRRDASAFDSRYYSVQNVEDETPDRAVLRRRPSGDWELLFAGDKALRKEPELHAAVTAGGDGHATEASQRWLSAQELAAMATEPFHLRGDHFAMILEPSALARILDYLAD